MAFYQFKREQIVNSSPEQLWDFISSPVNLKKITPASMGFEITSGSLPVKMYAGMIISYRVKPLPGYSTTWVTEITHIEPGKYFVDEQRQGPYSLWHHEHLLEVVKGGVKMTDIISYAPPFGILGRIANAVLIKNQLKKIFDYRVEAISKIFPPH
ncbi:MULTISPECIES: SRPBCC family protein [unclassified Saccharicrinis]|uniref:SRPBCC family protein n=1 Tax=unclassified Saccharicrinis TaxID=2646859 RepID=UPI003D347DE4